MPVMSVSSFFSKLDKSLKEKNASYETRLGQHMACRAAIYLLYGKEGEDIHPTITDIDSEAVTYYANKLLTMDPSIKDYAVRCYGGIDPERVDLRKLKFEYFLYHNLDKLQLPTLTEMAVRPGLRKTLKNRERNDNLSCADHWYSRWPDQEAARNRGDHQEKDESVYQYEAPDSVWKDYLAASYLADNMGVISTKDIVRNSNRRNNPFDKLTLRNKQTVEKVQRGEFSAIRQARKDTEASFTFRREKDLREAQEATQRLDAKMYLCVGDVADSQEWKAVRSAVQKFGKAKDPAAAAEASANVLLAVEKFTKGKKNAKQSSDVKACVDLAMQALGTTIPDAARNPSVKPLVDRFNDVRAFRFQKPVDIGSNKYLSVSSRDSEAKSYTFLRSEDLVAAKKKALDLHQQMQTHADSMSGNPEWGKVTQALQRFIVADDKVNAAIASSDLMDAVEKFTKGKKNLNQTPAVAACVDLAMKALGAAIPNAAEHARVIPLVDRFNEVRDKRGQAHIDIDANQSLSANVSTREFLDRQREKLGRFMTDALNAPGARVIYEGQNREPIMMLMDEQELRENFALAIAVDEAFMGELVIQNDGFDARVKALEKDPIVEEMARRVANDPGERMGAQVNKNARDLSHYLKAKYRQIQQEKSNDLDRELEDKHREIEELRKEHQKLEQAWQEKENLKGPAKEEPKPEGGEPLQKQNAGEQKEFTEPQHLI